METYVEDVGAILNELFSYGSFKVTVCASEELTTIEKVKD